MPGRDDRGRHLDQFRLALAENVSMEEAGRRLAERASAERIAASRKNHGEALRRLYAKGYGHTHRRSNHEQSNG